MFQLTDEEVINLRSQNVTSSLNNNNYGGRRYNPYAFTEQSIYMLMTVLRGKKVVNRNIMRFPEDFYFQLIKDNIRGDFYAK